MIIFLACFYFGMALIAVSNLAYMRRPGTAPENAKTVVLIPARNEARKFAKIAPPIAGGRDRF